MTFIRATNVGIRGAVVILLIAHTAAAQAAANWRGVDRAIDAVRDTVEHADSTARLHALGKRFDDAIVVALNAGVSVDSLNHILARRNGYAGPSPGQPTIRTDRATFWRELPRDAPTYYVSQLGADAPGILVGVFQVPWSYNVNGPSQLSIYSRVNDRWQRSAGFVSHRQLLLYRIPGRDGPPVLATMETWTRADGSEGELKLWRVQDGLLRRIPRADTALFQDVDVEETDSALYLSSSQFPREVDACTMCTRLMHQHMFTASAGRVHEMKVSLTPWADLVDELYGELARGRVAAAQRLLLSPLRASELAGAGPRFHADTGDFEAGEGTAVVQLASSECDRTLRFRSRRQDDGRWLIVRVDRGRWNWDSDVFIPESKKSQTKGLCD